MLAELSSSDTETIFLVLALVAFAVAVWRATLRDVVGTVLCAGIGLVILLVAF
jgi:asparagine N-glycosylation enzyme membrane subunit Stt3